MKQSDLSLLFSASLSHTQKGRDSFCVCLNVCVCVCVFKCHECQIVSTGRHVVWSWVKCRVCLQCKLHIHNRRGMKWVKRKERGWGGLVRKWIVEEPAVLNLWEDWFSFQSELTWIIIIPPPCLTVAAVFTLLLCEDQQQHSCFTWPLTLFHILKFIRHDEST